MIKRVIFDIDQTLICDVDFKKCIKASFYEYGIDDETAMNIFSNSFQDYELTMGKYDRMLFAYFMSKKTGCNLNQIFLDIFFKHLYPAVKGDSEKLSKMLDGLDKYELVILSNFFSCVQMERLRKLNIDKYFSEFHGENVCKPNKEAFIEAVGNKQIDECVMIGDNPVFDIKPATDLGMKTIQIGEDIDDVIYLTPEIIENKAKIKKQM